MMLGERYAEFEDANNVHVLSTVKSVDVHVHTCKHMALKLKRPLKVLC